MKWKKCLTNICNLLAHTYLEKNETFNVSKLIENTINKYDNDNISKELIPRSLYEMVKKI